MSKAAKNARTNPGLAAAAVRQPDWQRVLVISPTGRKTWWWQLSGSSWLVQDRPR